MKTTKAKKPVKKVRRVATVKSKVTSKAITFNLTSAEIKAARECMRKSGEVRYTFKEIRASKLPHVLDDGKQID
jgi:hypothetical protein